MFQADIVGKVTDEEKKRQETGTGAGNCPQRAKIAHGHDLRNSPAAGFSRITIPADERGWKDLICNIRRAEAGQKTACRSQVEHDGEERDPPKNPS